MVKICFGFREISGNCDFYHKEGHPQRKILNLITHFVRLIKVVLRLGEAYCFFDRFRPCPCLRQRVALASAPVNAIIIFVINGGAKRTRGIQKKLSNPGSKPLIPYDFWVAESESGTKYYNTRKLWKNTASNGWLARFKKRHRIRCLNIKGEKLSANEDDASAFRGGLKAFLENHGYKLDNIYNGDETSLFWKHVPTKTFLCQNETEAPGRKASKDRVTIQVCSNAYT
ncbi:hypothetical protein NQ318_008036 [Aromia moschata]|uniref:Transposase n=1 Tax=Aromia moschata TaxID=1265417 RepID=A0AAV8XXZ5_9CUCU|nr:hypothetical protein NQ318_008036 [Aromia moschata]